MPSRSEPDPPPARLPWPPILMAGTLLFGLALDRASGGLLQSLAAFPGPRAAGGVIVALSLANDIWCAMTLARHETTILPHRPAARLATDGPFQWSRNPIYLSHIALIFGVGLLIGSPFTMLLTPFLAFALRKLAIEPEERHLTRKFGAEYSAYLARTPRWL